MKKAAALKKSHGTKKLFNVVYRPSFEFRFQVKAKSEQEAVEYVRKAWFLSNSVENFDVTLPCCKDIVNFDLADNCMFLDPEVVEKFDY